MTAQIHFLNTDAGYATARHVLASGQFDIDAQAVAAEVLIHSADAKDRALVKLHDERMAAAMAAQRAAAPAQAEDARRKLLWLVAAMAVAGGILGGVLMEAAMTAHVAAVL
jgi:hypothetical protein